MTVHILYRRYTNWYRFVRRINRHFQQCAVATVQLLQLPFFESASLGYIQQAVTAVPRYRELSSSWNWIFCFSALTIGLCVFRFLFVCMYPYIVTNNSQSFSLQGLGLEYLTLATPESYYVHNVQNANIPFSATCRFALAASLYLSIAVLQVSQL